MDRIHELEIVRRSLAMLSPGSPALNREAALDLVTELMTLQQREDERQRKGAKGAAEH